VSLPLKFGFRLRTFLTGPVIRVTVRAVRANRIFPPGAVQAPGIGKAIVATVFGQSESRPYGQVITQENQFDGRVCI